jgi:hypothetical protein
MEEMMKIRPFAILGSALALASLTSATPSASVAVPPDLRLQQEVIDYYKGLTTLMLDMDPYNSRYMDVVKKLESYSDKVFRVVPLQTFNGGQAHAGGLILIDISALAKSETVLAYLLAHEWGHEALGHQPNLYNPTGSSWKLRASPTEIEDEADEYAGEFLAHFNYDIEPVVRYLERLPENPADVEHSTGSQRARRVQRAYDAYRREHGKYIIKTRKTECFHTRHWADISPVTGSLTICAHQMHLSGDTRYFWNGEDEDVVRFSIRIRQLPRSVPGPLASVTITIDDVEVGTVHNWKSPYSVSVNQFGAGEHQYKLRAVITSGYPPQPSVQQDSGSFTLRKGDRFLLSGDVGGSISMGRED